MKIEVLGCGSAFSTQYNTSSICITDRAQRSWLIDCGPTIARAWWQRGHDINVIDALYFTHIHPDHCAGLPVLLSQWQAFGRTAPLDIYCQAEQMPSLKSLVALAVWPHDEFPFAIYWHAVCAEFRWHDWHIRTAQTQHAVTNRALRIEADGQTLFYSGDGRPTDASIALMQGAMLAFQECASLEALSTDASHGDFPSCLSLLATGAVERLGLYHCYDEFLPQLRQRCAGHAKLFVSEDGLCIDLDDGLLA